MREDELQLIQARADINRYRYPPTITHKLEKTVEAIGAKNIDQLVKDGVIKLSGDDTQKEAQRKALNDAAKSFGVISPFVTLGAIIDSATNANKSLVENVANTISNDAKEVLVSTGSRPTGQCPPGQTASRGFLIFGPEGWRTFDQNERLILAMYSDSSPLINTLSKYSDKLSQARLAKPNSQKAYSEELLDVTQKIAGLPSQDQLNDCLSAPDVKCDDLFSNLLGKQSSETSEADPQLEGGAE